MRLLHIRIIGICLLAYILFIKAWILMPYWSAMMLSLEILNHQKQYLTQPNFRVYNWFFIGYLVLVVVDKTRKIHLNEVFEWSFNSMMHILFGLIVCFKISQYLRVFNAQIKNRTLSIALIFNVIGVLNEFMQNIMNGRQVFELIADSRKDLMMNVVGTLVFMGIEYVLNRKARPQ
jgi:VanZ family protein